MNRLTLSHDPIQPNGDSRIELLTRLARTYSDGHFTILKFTTNWRVALDTPALATGAGREEIRRWATGATLEEAVHNLVRNLNPYLADTAEPTLH